MTGRMLDERLGRWNFWTMFIGFNLGFFPMHIAGLLGMPRRIYTYPGDMGWNTVNLITTIGSFILAIGILLLIINVIVSRRRGEIAGPNPWDAPTLEWSTSSPPPPYNFAVIPSVASRHPLWDGRLKEAHGTTLLDRGLVLKEGHETLGVTAMDGEPDVILKMPEETYVPVCLSFCIAVFFTGLLVHIWALAGAAFIAGILVVVWWMWPRGEYGQTEDPAHV
jgi:cytochrome c oxidase subunit 1/cytochrome c oxidase subunit I+III